MRRPFGQRFLVVLAAGLLSVAASLASPSVAARDLTAIERGALARTVARFDTAMRRQDIPAIIDVVPPRIIAHMAARHGVDPRRIRGATIQTTREVMKSAVIRGFRIDVARAHFGATPNGAPYALIPTHTVLRMGGQDITKSSNSLAMMDGGRWYLLDLNQPSRVAIFTQVYPEFQGVPLGGQGI